jgi:signal transduction histidine kinase
MTHLQVAVLLAAGIHIPLALTVWTMLYRRWPRRPLLAWVTGSLAMGAGATLFAAQGLVPDWASNELGSALLSVALALRIAALRIDLGWQLRARRLAGLCLLDFSLYAYSLRHFTEEHQVLLGFTAMGLWAVAFTWHAAVIGWKNHSRSGRNLAIAEGLFAGALLVRVVAMTAGWTTAKGMTEEWDFLLLVVTGLAAALYGNIGYLGLVLDRTSVAAKLSNAAQLAEAVKREAAEARATELRATLEQRDRLLHMLAHEIRQPLHNANGALQAAASTLAAPLNNTPGTAVSSETVARMKTRTADMLRQARGVLMGVQSMLDNTLAAATLLSQQTHPVLVNTDLDFLIQLTLGDLPDDQHARVQLHWQPGLRSAELEPGLVRLALRNLLRNAFVHGGPAVQVSLEVCEQESPATVVLRVVDNGPGAPLHVLRGERQERAAGSGGHAKQPGQPGQQGPAGDDPHFIGGQHSDGLAIVRQVMRLHGGELKLAAGSPSGLHATLLFPQPA